MFAQHLRHLGFRSNGKGARLPFLCFLRTFAPFLSHVRWFKACVCDSEMAWRCLFCAGFSALLSNYFTFAPFSALLSNNYYYYYYYYSIVELSISYVWHMHSHFEQKFVAVVHNISLWNSCLCLSFNIH